MLVARRAIPVTIAVPEERLNEVVSRLVAEVLLEPREPEGVSRAPFSELLTRLRSAREDLHKLITSLGLPVPPLLDVVILRSKDWVRNAQSVLSEYEELRSGLEALVERRQKMEEEIAKFSALAERLLPLSVFDVDLSLIPRSIRALLLVAPPHKCQTIGQLPSVEPRVLVELNATEAYCGALLLFSEQLSENVRDFLAREGLEPVAIPPDLPQNPMLAFSYVSSRLEALTKAEGGVVAQAPLYHERVREVLSKIDAVERALVMLSMAEARRGYALVRGYADPDRMVKLKEALRDSTGGSFALLTEDPREAPFIPSVVRVVKPLKPFHEVVVQFGAPLPNELVPTLFIAFTFPLIFALMFPDAGHALVILLFGLYYHLKRGSSFGLLLVYLGAAAFVSGILAGEFFGPLLGLKYVLWGGKPPLEAPIEAKSPEEALMVFVGLSLKAASLMLITGTVLSLVNSLLQGEKGKALTLKLPKVVMFSVPLSCFLLFDVERSMAIIGDAVFAASTFYGAIVRYSFIASVIALLAVHPLYERLKHGKGAMVGESLLESFMEVFESALMLIGNTASFLRIMGIALAHVGIMYGFAAMAERAFEAGVMGYFLGGLAYAFGNILGIGLEGIVAYAHCTRLHFYEMMTKFYSGQGRLLSPLGSRVRVMFSLEA